MMWFGRVRRDQDGYTAARNGTIWLGGEEMMFGVEKVG